jgi:hypothetical protein
MHDTQTDRQSPNSMRSTIDAIKLIVAKSCFPSDHESAAIPSSSVRFSLQTVSIFPNNLASRICQHNNHMPPLPARQVKRNAPGRPSLRGSRHASNTTFRGPHADVPQIAQRCAFEERRISRLQARTLHGSVRSGLAVDAPVRCNPKRGARLLLYDIARLTWDGSAGVDFVGWTC